MKNCINVGATLQGQWHMRNRKKQISKIYAPHSYGHTHILQGSENWVTKQTILQQDTS
jgi:hypothetical protein